MTAVSPTSSVSDGVSTYAHVIRGGLKLKGKPLLQAAVVAGQGRKKKRTSRASPRETLTQAASKTADASLTSSHEQSDNGTSANAAETVADSDTKRSKLTVLKEDDRKLLENLVAPHESLTPAEKAFRLAQKKREAERTNKRLALTHRQRMERFNAQLMTLPEHFDIPKVGPG